MGVPFYTVVSRDAMGQIFALAMFSAATLLFGQRVVHPRLFAGLVFILGLMLLVPTPYPVDKVSGLAWGVLLSMGCLVGARMNKEPVAWSWFMSAILVAAVISAMEGVLQWLGLSGPLWPWVDEPEIRGVAYGAFRQTNLFATFLVCGMIAVFWAVCTQRMTKPMAWALTLLLSVGVAASGSRTGFAHVLVLSIAAWIWRRRLPAGVPWLIMGQIVAVALTYPVLTWLAKVIGFPVFTAVDSMFNSERLALWSNVAELVLERPWLGWGRSELVYAQYITVVQTRYPEVLSHSHNLLLQAAFEFGVPLVIAAIGLMLWAVWRTTPWREKKWTDWGCGTALGPFGGVRIHRCRGRYSRNVGVPSFLRGFHLLAWRIHWKHVRRDGIQLRHGIQRKSVPPLGAASCRGVGDRFDHLCLPGLGPTDFGSGHPGCSI
jgi:O-antigen ligase